MTETKNEVLRINIKILTGLISVLLAVVAGIVWGARLEYHTEENDRANVRQDVTIKQLESDRADGRERQIRLEGDLKHLVTSMEEVKVLIKQVHGRP